MRISTTMIFRQGVDGIQRLTNSNVKTQQQISTGHKINTPEDDPVAMTKILSLQGEISSIDQYQKNVDLAQNRLTLEDTTLQSANTIIDRVTGLATQANNGSTTIKDRQNIAVEVRENLKALQDLLNTKDAAGNYMFSGFKGDTKPFLARSAGGYTYQGDDGQRFINIAKSNSVAVSDSGKSIFVDVPSTQKTFVTKELGSNSANPKGYISAGRVFDQAKYDANFPSDYVITFQPLANSTPPGKANFSVVRKSDGQPMTGTTPASALTNITYTPGQAIQFNGVEVSLSGAPQPGDSYLVEASTTQDLLTSVDKLASALENLQNDTVYSADGQTLGVATAASTTAAAAGNGVAAQVLTLRDDLDVVHTVSVPANATAKQIAQLVKNYDGVTARYKTNTATLNISGTTTAPGDTISFTLNGTSISATVGATTAQTYANLSNAIATQASTTGVAVVNNNNGTFSLSTSDGSDIAVENFLENNQPGATATLTGASGSAVTLTSGGNDSSVVAASVSIVTPPGWKISSSVDGNNTTSGGLYNDAHDTQIAPDEQVLSQEIGNALGNLQNAQTNITTTLAKVGARQNMIDSTKTMNDSFKTQAQTLLSSVRDTDFTAAASDLNMESTLLQASLQSFSKISSMSLFKLLS